ncbi:hypothetical protein MRX96_053843, partial [Rhipicephalus microplus]
MHWARATGFKNKKKHCVMAVPVLYPSLQYELGIIRVAENRDDANPRRSTGRCSLLSKR